MSPHSSPRDLDDRGRRRTTRAPHAPHAIVEIASNDRSSGDATRDANLNSEF